MRFQKLHCLVSLVALEEKLGEEVEVDCLVLVPLIAPLGHLLSEFAIC
jgi:hypothetical protein